MVRHRPRYYRKQWDGMFEPGRPRSKDDTLQTLTKLARKTYRTGSLVEDEALED